MVSIVLNKTYYCDLTSDIHRCFLDIAVMFVEKERFLEIVVTFVEKEHRNKPNI